MEEELSLSPNVEGIPKEEAKEPRAPSPAA